MSKIIIQKQPDHSIILKSAIFCKQQILRFTTLTKGGLRAVRDFDLLAGYDKASFGSTLIFTNQADADKWEPNAPKVDFRIEALKEAKRRGTRSWVSLEPVIFPDQALESIENLHPFVNHWKVGKLNYRRLSVDWLKFREDVTGLLNALGADYYLKRSLRDIDQPKGQGDVASLLTYFLV